MGAIGRITSAVIATIIVSGVIVGTVGQLPAAAAPVLTIEPITYNVIGLDSNDVTDGPNSFPLGVRVCNTGSDPATNVRVEVVWDTANAYIDLDSAPTRTRDELAAGACYDVQWQAVVARDPAAYDTTRRFHATASADGLSPVSTPTPRELYVEHLISQNRNQVLSIAGSNQLTVGETTTLVLDATTAPGGYEQLETYLDLPSELFEFVAVDVDYGAPTGATNDKVYADACGWDHDPTSPTYRTCVGPENYPGGKAGGQMQLRYTVRAVGAGTATLSAVIFDQSGASYHYNSDYGTEPNLFTVTVSEPVTTTPPAAPATTPTSAPSTPTTPPAAADSLPETGQASRRLSLMALSLISFGAGFVVIAGPRRRSRSAPTPAAVGRLVVASDQLRSSLNRHPDDPFAPVVARLLTAVEQVSASLRG